MRLHKEQRATFCALRAGEPAPVMGFDGNLPEVATATVGTPVRPQCGARTRAGGECRAPCVWDRKLKAPKNGRCRRHGGLASGPTSEQGRKRAITALRQGHIRWRLRQGHQMKSERSPIGDRQE